jgi:hypothetical protein
LCEYAALASFAILPESNTLLKDGKFEILLRLMLKYARRSGFA